MLLVLACTPPAPEAGLPTAYEAALGDGDDADAPIEALAADLQVAVDRLLSLHGTAALEGYDLAMDSADAACPTQSTYGSNRFWEADCTSSEGGVYRGYVTQLVYAGLPIDDGYYSGQGLVGSFTVLDAEGRTFLGSGFVYTLAGNTDAGEHTWAWIDGAWAWDGPGAEDTWVADGLSPHVRIDARREGGVRRVTAEGGMAWPDLVVDYRALDATEGACPAGALGLRAGDGTWYTFTFDPSCDGCGGVTRQERSLGGVCLDLAPLFDWDTRPW